MGLTSILSWSSKAGVSGIQKYAPGDKGPSRLRKNSLVHWAKPLEDTIFVGVSEMPQHGPFACHGRSKCKFRASWRSFRTPESTLRKRLKNVFPQPARRVRERSTRGEGRIVDGIRHRSIHRCWGKHCASLRSVATHACTPHSSVTGIRAAIRPFRASRLRARPRTPDQTTRPTGCHRARLHVWLADAIRSPADGAEPGRPGREDIDTARTRDDKES